MGVSGGAPSGLASPGWPGMATGPGRPAPPHSPLPPMRGRATPGRAARAIPGNPGLARPDGGAWTLRMASARGLRAHPNRLEAAAGLRSLSSILHVPRPSRLNRSRRAGRPAVEGRVEVVQPGADGGELLVLPVEWRARSGGGSSW
jgi:hypothetical protein